jgi:pre-rRNA-processing protein TSR4
MLKLKLIHNVALYSWVCIRSQVLETGSNTSNTAVNTLSTSEWCTDADDWEDDNNGNNSEENGNVIGRIESFFSDEEDETEECEDDVQVQLGNLSVDERNANWEGGRVVTAGAGAGAVGRLHSPSATAEIEGDESEVVSVSPLGMVQFTYLVQNLPKWKWTLLSYIKGACLCIFV